MVQRPIAPRHPHVHSEHGVERADAYHWMKDRSHPELIPHLEAENAWTIAALSHRDAERKSLYQEMLDRIQEDDDSVPYSWSGFWYYSRTVPGQAYRVWCRRRGSMEAPEQVILNENELAEGKGYLSVQSLRISPDHLRIAWLEDNDGAERFTLKVRELASGETQELATGLKWSIAWAADSRRVFACRGDEAQRPYQIVRIDSAGEQGEALVYEEPDERFYLGVSNTRDRRFVVITAQSKITTEIRVIDARAPESVPLVLKPRVPGVEARVTHHDGGFYLLLNDAGENFRLVRQAAPPSKAPPEEVLAHDEDVLLSDVMAFAGHLVVWERAEGLPRVRVIDLETGDHHHPAFPEPAYALSPEVNVDYAGELLRWTWSSPRTPQTTESWNMRTRSRQVLKVQPVLGDFDPERYAVRRLFAQTADGERVPISLVGLRELEPGEGHPLLMLGYGAYGINYDASFARDRLSLIDRGVLVAIAHIRGGSELGRRWYNQGKLEHKTHTFTDFIAAAECLIAEGWTRPDKLAISGGSAGGLLIGAVLNARPELFRAAVAQVPFVDVTNTMLDASLPLTVIEYEEWGNPNEREAFDRILAYSPYDQVSALAYPDIYVVAGLNDPRVGYWEPAKWVAKLRELGVGDKEVLLKVHLGAGHAGASGRYGRLDDVAWRYTFLLDRLEVFPPVQ